MGPLADVPDLPPAPTLLLHDVGPLLRCDHYDVRHVRGRQATNPKSRVLSFFT